MKIVALLCCIIGQILSQNSYSISTTVGFFAGYTKVFDLPPTKNSLMMSLSGASTYTYYYYVVLTSDKSCATYFYVTASTCQTSKKALTTCSCFNAQNCYKSCSLDPTKTYSLILFLAPLFQAYTALVRPISIL
jgi:hypothetical protein